MAQPTLSKTLLLKNASIITMNAKRKVWMRADLRIAEGRIAALGERLAKTKSDTVIDLTGKALLPGFVQCHVHLCQTLFRGSADDLALLPWLKKRIWPMEHAHNEASLRASCDLGLLEMMLSGTTTILDMGTVRHQDVVFEAMLNAGVRGFSGKAMMDQGQGMPKGMREDTRASLHESDALAARWNAMAKLGYAYAPRFILSCSEKLLREVGDRVQHGARAHSHAAEHQDERDFVRETLGDDDVNLLYAYGISGPRTVLAHGVQLTPRQMRDVAGWGTRFVHCPSANLKLASGIADVVAMKSAGMVVGLGADGAPCNNRMDAFTQMREASLLAKVKRNDATALKAMEALALATIDGARALGMEHEVGSLEVGKSADIACIALTENPALWPFGTPEQLVANLVYAASAADVTDVWIAGERWVKNRTHVSLDANDVRVRSAAEFPKLLKRAR